MLPPPETWASIDASLSAERYNRIKTFHEQHHAVEQCILQSLAEIFIKHGMHTQFGIILLHRHQDLPQDWVMLHSKPDVDTMICSMEPLGPDELFPYAYYLDAKDDFVPFEFSRSPTVVPEKNFLSALASFLWHHNLNDTLALSQLSPPERPWSEHLLPDSRGTIATRLSLEMDLLCMDNVITEWVFSVANTGVLVRPLKECVEPPSGGHKQQNA